MPLSGRIVMGLGSDQNCAHHCRKCLFRAAPCQVQGRCQSGRKDGVGRTMEGEERARDTRVGPCQNQCLGWAWYCAKKNCNSIATAHPHPKFPILVPMRFINEAVYPLMWNGGVSWFAERAQPLSVSTPSASTPDWPCPYICSAGR